MSLIRLRNCLRLSNHLVAATRATSNDLTLPQQTVLMQKCFYAKHKAPSSNKKNTDKSKSSIDDILDQLSSDDDEPKGDKADVLKEHEDEIPAHTPAAQFVKEFAKRKSDPKGKTKTKGGHTTKVTYVDVHKLVDIETYWNDLHQILEELKHFYAHHLTLRSANAVDDLEVELEGDVYPLKEIADISKKDPKRVVIDTSAFPQATATVMKALGSSSMNLNPQQDGTRIYVPIPKVTRETRERLARSAKEKLNETKDKMRKLQNKINHTVADFELSGKIAAPKDHFVAVQQVIHGVEENFVQLAEQMMHKKQQDVLGKS